jgi:ribosomal protein S26
MMKWLFLVALLAVLFYLWRHRVPHGRGTPSVALVRCARCGVWLPHSAATHRQDGTHLCPYHSKEDS